ncbi:hypothetical protein B0H14DRAFT_2821203 [Mycena olivaceomarginata]|nr:hypothetical protein B0H14DRAFT_2821203 [Mycena olivaceomarginata]
MLTKMPPPPGWRWKITTPKHPRPKGPHKKPPLVPVGPGSPERPIYIGPGTQGEPWEFDLEDEVLNGASTSGATAQVSALPRASFPTSKNVLTPEDLYKNRVLPPTRPAQSSSNPALQCAVCQTTYTHPVMLVGCRHTFCYACICCVMQHELKCPICRDVICRQPIQVSRVLEEFIEEDNKAAGVTDTSIVDYSWAGVNFRKGKGKHRSQ